MADFGFYAKMANRNTDIITKEQKFFETFISSVFHGCEREIRAYDKSCYYGLKGGVFLSLV
jgi:hypothetical protein